MIQIVASSDPSAARAEDVFLLPVLDDGLMPEQTASMLNRVGCDLSESLRRDPLRAGDTRRVVAAGATPRDMVLVGIGSQGSTGCLAADDLRRACQAAGRELTAHSALVAFAGLELDTGERSTGVATEALVVGNYEYTCRRSDAPVRLERVTVLDADAGEAAAASAIAKATNFCRDLVNTPAGDLTPQDIVGLCRDEADKRGWRVRVIEGDALTDGGFGGLVAVGAASENPPALIAIERGASGADAPIALVGKGISFDSGGLDLKSLDAMGTMKGDMGGLAAVIAALTAADELGLDLPVRAYLACAENMIGPKAVRPGDVLRHRNGKTTEVISPDAEGRLVLADALAYAVEEKPEVIVDVATLTGSTSLGEEIWAVLGSDPALISRLLSAGARSGDPGWPLPLWAPYADKVRGPVADLRNAGPEIRWNFGAILGGLYLREFTGDVPWAHLDISATNFRREPSRLWPHGATGTATRALIRFLRDWGRPQDELEDWFH